MGADPVLALNVAAFPGDLPSETVAQILRGGADKVAEAHAVVAGGHTIIDAEPKYGLCVLGLVHPDRILTKAGARPGDAVYLTKPLGAGLVTTAAKFEEAKPEDLSAAIASMTRLNCCASRMAREAGVRALTDVTGYGILGHAYEMAARRRRGHPASRPRPYRCSPARWTTPTAESRPGAAHGTAATSTARCTSRRTIGEEMEPHPVRPPDLRRPPLRRLRRARFPALEDAFGTSRAAALAGRRGHREPGVSVVP